VACGADYIDGVRQRCRDREHVFGPPAARALTICVCVGVSVRVCTTAARTGRSPITDVRGAHHVGIWMPMVDPGMDEPVLTQFIRPVQAGDYVPGPMNTPEQFWPCIGFDQMSLDRSIAIGMTGLEGAHRRHAGIAPRIRRSTSAQSYRLLTELDHRNAT
jgi:hypothetical protein